MLDKCEVSHYTILVCIKVHRKLFYKIYRLSLIHI